MATPIGTLGTIPTLTVGGRVFTDLTTLIELTGFCGNTNTNASLRLYSGSSGYQVTVGKTLTLHAQQISWTTASGSAGFALGYADNDVGMDSGTAFTNPVWRGGTSSNKGIYPTITTGSSGSIYQTAFKVNCIAQKYVAFNGTSGVGGNYITTWGYET